MVKTHHILFLFPQAGISQNTLMHLAIFRVFPLQIVGIIEINKEVCKSLYVVHFYIVHESYVTVKVSKLMFQVFGNSVSDVVLSQGVLAVSYSTKVVKLYSFEHIVNEVFLCTLFALGEYLILMNKIQTITSEMHFLKIFFKGFSHFCILYQIWSFGCSKPLIH